MGLFNLLLWDMGRAWDHYITPAALIVFCVVSRQAHLLPPPPFLSPSAVFLLSLFLRIIYF